MKIAIAATGPSLGATVASRPEGCSHFLIVDTDDLDAEVVENPDTTVAASAGAEATRVLADKGVNGRRCV